MAIEWRPTWRRVWVFDKRPPLYRFKPIWLHIIRREGKIDGFQAQFFNRRLMTYSVYVGLARLEIG